MTAFRATYSDWKLVKTRGVVQVVMEVPLAEADAAYDVLGGMPNPANETWFGIAPINLHRPAKETKQVDDLPQATSSSVNHKPPAGTKRSWEDLQPQQQAGIRCGEPTFVAFLKEQYRNEWRGTDGAAECVRFICGVHSRVELGTNQKASVIWHQLDCEYRAWLAGERVGA